MIIFSVFILFILCFFFFRCIWILYALKYILKTGKFPKYTPSIDNVQFFVFYVLINIFSWNFTKLNDQFCIKFEGQTKPEPEEGTRASLDKEVNVIRKEVKNVLEIFRKANNECL